MSAACVSRRGFALACLLIGLAGAAEAQPLTGHDLLQALRSGGYVIVMRHASSPEAPPRPGEIAPGNRRRERQLDAAGRRDAIAMGAAIQRLHIPIGEVWSSPTFRALQTVRLAGLPNPRIAPELGDHGRSMSMQAVSLRWTRWLRDQTAALPRSGSNVLIVTQEPNIVAAFGKEAEGLAPGEALVFHPDAAGGKRPVTRLRIEDWPKLDQR
jgi:broad specificity phosphatase PhoE